MRHASLRGVKDANRHEAPFERHEGKTDRLSMTMTKTKPDEVRDVLRTCRSYFLSVGIFSLAINLLYLASPLYMLQVYDRVISSASVVTLVMLTLALLIAFSGARGSRRGARAAC